MKKTATLFFIITFILSLYFVGSTVVGFLLGLLPASAHDLLPFLKVVFWIVTFTFNAGVTALLYYIIIVLLIGSIYHTPKKYRDGRKVPSNSITGIRNSMVTKSRFQQRLEQLSEERKKTKGTYLYDEEQERKKRS